MEAARILGHKVKSRALTTGILATHHLWPELVEISKNSGLDYIIVDTEHGAFSPELICEVCALGRLLNFAILIRPISHDISTIRKTLDMGPCGLLLPSVDNPEILDEVRDGIYMPPRGQRRPGGPGTRWVGSYSYATWKSEVEDDLIILPQIETRQGLKNLPEIARHEIVTALAIGPYDLSADLGVCGETTSQPMQQAIEEIRQAARAVGKTMWIIGDAPSLAKQGFTFLCLGEPMGLLEATMKRIVQQVHSGS